MKIRPTPLCALGIGLALLGYGATRLLVRPPAPAEVAAPGAQLAWLANEFSLRPDQVAAIRRLQADYAPVCAEHCAAIARTQDALAAVADPSESRATAESELTRLKLVCADATRAHLRSVAALMTPDQGARFLALMEPRVAHTADRLGAPSLDVRP